MDELNELNDTMKQQNKIASDWLVYYWERKREHEERRQELSSKKERAAGLSTGLSKPTEMLAVNFVDHDCFSNTALWLEVVETVYNMVGRKKRLLLKLRQECRFYASPNGGRPGWIAPVQVRFGEEMGFVPAEQVLRNMWEDIIYITVRLALMKKCKF